MKTKLLFVSMFVLLVSLLSVVVADAQGPKPSGGKTPNGGLTTTAFIYQGQLKQNGSAVNGSCDFQFTLYDAAIVGNVVGTTPPPVAATVSSGLFTAQVDFGVSAFNGDPRWLDIQARCPAGSGAFTPLTPRQQLMPAPMAFALPGLYTQQNGTSPNIIGGYSGNAVDIGIYGAMIGGGGRSGNINHVGGNYATISGGISNTIISGATYATIGGGYNNTVNDIYDTLSGGTDNTASNQYATVGGGQTNNANGYGDTIAGGEYNNASNWDSTVGGGHTNTASGIAATVPGGQGNLAQGNYSFAAGYRAKANHIGAFVWADSTSADFASTANDQFLIRADGGVGIGTNSPAAQLNVSSGDIPQVRIDQTNSSDYARLRMTVASSANFWDIAVGPNSNNVMNFFKQGTGNVMSLSGGATHITMMDGATESGGNWNNFSDRNAKENFASLESASVLARVVNLPITSWNYKTEDASVRHIGPMAQDFYAAFHVGADDRHISTVDEGGVALAAIQGLNQVVQEKDAKITAQQKQIDDLNARLTALEQLAQANNGSAHSDNTGNIAMIVIGALFGIVVVRQPWNGGNR